jgi:hypothetical protein
VRYDIYILLCGKGLMSPAICVFVAVHFATVNSVSIVLYVACVTACWSYYNGF